LTLYLTHTLTDVGAALGLSVGCTVGVAVGMAVGACTADMDDTPVEFTTVESEAPLRRVCGEEQKADTTQRTTALTAVGEAVGLVVGEAEGAWQPQRAMSEIVLCLRQRKKHVIGHADSVEKAYRSRLGSRLTCGQLRGRRRRSRGRSLRYQATRRLSFRQAYNKIRRQVS